jgi:Flp pilus assembly pilin Flp
MKVALKRLWSEQDGAIVSAEIVLVMSILVIGLIAGLTSLRDAVVEELADVGGAIGSLNQSFSFSASSGHCGITFGSFFVDTFDTCDLPTASSGSELNSRCVAVCTVAAVAETAVGT